MTLYHGYLLPESVTVIACALCGLEHPSTRRHCAECGRPSLFITPAGECVTCTKEAA